MYHDVVITASNRSQAEGYEAELALRERDGRLPEGTAFHVMADPGGRRVGSGAATLVVLEKLATRYRTTPAQLADERRILILHSGGDSRRLPAYAAHGKLFLPLPRGDEYGRGVSLFDLLLRDLSSLTLGAGGRVVVAAGDVYLSLGSQPLELTGGDVVGVALRGSPAAGTRHGVYVAGAEGSVAGFLQKPSVEDAERAGAVGPDGTLLLDSGVVSLSARSVGALVAAARLGGVESLLAGVLKGTVGSLDFYEHLLIGLFTSRSPDEYAGALAEKGGAAYARLRAFKAALTELTGRIVTAEKSRFVHIGTTRELLERLGVGFAPPPPLAPHSRNAVDHDRLVFNSVVKKRIAAQGRVIIEGSVLNGAWRLGGDNVVVGVPTELRRGVSLPRGMGAVFLPVGQRNWAVLLFGDRDDFKSPLGAGVGTLLNNATVPAWLTGTTLWDAPLWHVAPLEKALESSLRLLRKLPDARPGAGSLSTREVMQRVDHRRLQGARLEAERLSRLERLGERLGAHAWLSAASVAADVRTKAEAGTAIKQLERVDGQDGSDALATRSLFLRGVLLQRHGSAHAARLATERAFARVRESVNHGVEPVTFPPRPAILPDQVVWATCPARLDLAGGWTDTPPICSEVGGAVINAAVTLNGQFPLQAICRLTSEPAIRLSSIDLGRSITYRTTGELLRVGDPSDWAALAKAALLLTGFVPTPSSRGRSTTLRQHLERFGAGLDVTLFSALPKGSGLGSSSILGATLIAALLRVLDPRGEAASTQRIIDLTSQLEQIMSTGGGWQDQAGGTTPGVKLVTSQPGATQALTFSPVPDGGALGSPEARARCLLYYTGQRRLAKNILRNVVGGYLGREPHVRDVIDRLKAGAIAMEASLRGGSLDEVGIWLSDYWSLKKRLDPGSTNPGIERLFSSIERELSGGTILGAGGGGFALFIARDEAAAGRVRRRLMGSRASALARFYDFSVDRQGLGVSVL